ncbi:MAG: FtsQ-type POTRA domain-containing protein [Oscillospiraceae bacterium]|jgi:cell division protein FtsQ|nr:FtsQ-type POTRA domain-containing protein [Oscillospiraceae bacterium]
MRRKKQREPRYGRRRLGFAAALVSVCLFMALALMSAGLFFRINEIEIRGVALVNPAAAREASEITVGKNIFLIDKLKASDAISRKFPYVESVSIRRELPGTVIIELTEARAACVVKHMGYYWMLDENVRVLGATPAIQKPEYAEVSGVTLLAPVAGRQAVFPQGEQEKLLALSRLLTALDEAGLLRSVKSINMEKVYDVYLDYEGRLEVRLGMPDDYAYKLSYIPHALKNGREGSWLLDVSVAREENVLLSPRD